MLKNIAFLAATVILTAGIGITAVKYLGSNSVNSAGLTPVYAQGYAGRGVGSMNGSGYGKGLDDIAEKLGMTSEELRAQLGDKTMLEIAAEKGYSEEEFHQMMSDLSLQRWQERGISDEEIAQRQAAQEERRANCDGNGAFRGSPFNK